MKIIVVTGGRDWDDEKTVRMALKEHAREGDLLIHGDCRGLDRQAGAVGASMGLRVEPMPAEWRNHTGCRCSEWKRTYSYCGFAGPRRNREMLDRMPDIVLAFHPNLNKSRGTKDCATEAVRRGIPTYYYDGHKIKGVTFHG